MTNAHAICAYPLLETCALLPVPSSHCILIFCCDLLLFSFLLQRSPNQTTGALNSLPHTCTYTVSSAAESLKVLLRTSTTAKQQTTVSEIRSAMAAATAIAGKSTAQKAGLAIGAGLAAGFGAYYITQVGISYKIAAAAADVLHRQP